ncbi:hypothetical protein [uncultured Shewanella sp.]|uniref:hypothetical protein n=1 Tax=uncultured Shewanella sp. TaxID=173975 RepID=UPI00260B8AD7|nr:hypothetical protein [uncultured Shewanella sp.]
MTADNTLILGVIGKSPFAEFMGDVSTPYCTENTADSDGYIEGCLYSLIITPYVPDPQLTTLAIDYGDFDKTLIDTIQNQDSNIPLITVLLSGRDLIIDATDTSPLPISDAFIAAWLPGPTGGTAIANSHLSKISNFLK